MKVLCTGELLIDMICTDHGKSLEQGMHFLKKPGGAPANVAAAIAALGGNTAIAAKVGRDPFGRQLIHEMQSFGVDTYYVFEDEKHFTTLAFVSLMENGERDFVFNRGADGNLSVEDLSKINISDFSILHFGSATAFLPGALQEAYTHLHSLALKSGKFISFDPNYRHLLYKDRMESFISQAEYFIKSCHLFKLSEEEALLITRQANLPDAVVSLQQMSDAVFCITLGAQGTLMRVGSETEVIPSIPVKPVDTTGAGDAFIGAVLYQLSVADASEIHSLGVSRWKKTVINANKAGARTCEFMGAMEAFRHLSVQIFND